MIWDICLCVFLVKKQKKRIDKKKKIMYVKYCIFNRQVKNTVCLQKLKDKSFLIFVQETDCGRLWRSSGEDP